MSGRIDGQVERGQAELPLSLAAKELGVSRERAMRMLLSGRVAGVLRHGRWYCDAESVALARGALAARDSIR